jgi:DNA repair exonuclease SbcCD ATPase subunit
MGIPTCTVGIPKEAAAPRWGAGDRRCDGTQMIENLLEQAFQQYGLVGLLVTFLTLGPGFTYLRTKNACLRAESRAQELLNEFLREEREHADQLEERLNQTLARLDAEKEEVFELKMQLARTQLAQNGLADLRQQLAALSDRLAALEETETLPPGSATP